MNTGNKLKEVIKLFAIFFKQVIHDNNNIINGDSYFKSDMSNILNNGKVLESRTAGKELGNVKELEKNNRNDNFLIFNIQGAKILFKEHYSILYQAKIDIDIYGENSNELILELYSLLFSNEAIDLFNTHNVGLNKEVEFNSINENINGVMWKRSNIVITFNYEYESITLKNKEKEFIKSIEIEMNKQK